MTCSYAMLVLLSLKDKLSQFRIKELKDVLTCVGLSKQGKKQVIYVALVGVFANHESSIFDQRGQLVCVIEWLIRYTFLCYLVSLSAYHLSCRSRACMNNWGP